jgi:hypothetical protein
MSKINELDLKKKKQSLPKADLSDPKVVAALRELEILAPKLTSLLNRMCIEIEKKKKENENL